MWKLNAEAMLFQPQWNKPKRKKHPILTFFPSTSFLLSSTHSTLCCTVGQRCVCGWRPGGSVCDHWQTKLLFALSLSTDQGHCSKQTKSQYEGEIMDGSLSICAATFITHNITMHRMFERMKRCIYSWKGESQGSMDVVQRTRLSHHRLELNSSFLYVTKHLG